MSNIIKIRLSENLQAFAEECVRTGVNGSISEVVCEALEEKKHAAVLRALDAADAELEAGLGKKSTVEEFMAEIDEAVALTP